MGFTSASAPLHVHCIRGTGGGSGQSFLRYQLPSRR